MFPKHYHNGLTCRIKLYTKLQFYTPIEYLVSSKSGSLINILDGKAMYGKLNKE